MTTPQASHGAVPRGQDPEGAAFGGRFAPLFALDPCEADDRQLVELFGRMKRFPEHPQNGLVPAGFTYLAQFVDHDITFDPLSKLMQRNDPHALRNFRTPRFDLDSVYGSGPRDQPYLYEWKSHSTPVAELLVDESGAGGQGDLPRSLDDRAIIGDPRNDEHLIIAQLHLLFIRFHNAVVAHLRRQGVAAEDLFDTAQRLVRWHYQWIVAHEFLCKIVGDDRANSVLEQNPRSGAPPHVRLEHYPTDREPFIPLEFSGAAYRFGHSMVRVSYTLNATDTLAPVFPDLDGFRPIPAERAIRWDRFFGVVHTGPVQPVERLRSGKIDIGIAPTLFELPEGQALPLLNLRRGLALGLPSGQAVAEAMQLPILDEAALLLDEPDRLPDEGLSADARRVLTRSTPLWYYILCEAHASNPSGGVRLGPVGGRIVAEVLVGLLAGDRRSYLHCEPTWRPHELFPDQQDFTMADLIRFTYPEYAKV